jgi:hypothetical protein
MTTLLHLSQSIADMQDHLSREQRFSHDACHNLLTGLKLCREAIDALERDIRNHFEERDRSVARLIGNSQPYATVIDTSPVATQVSVGHASPEAASKTAFNEEEDQQAEYPSAA